MRAGAIAILALLATSCAPAPSNDTAASLDNSALVLEDPMMAALDNAALADATAAPKAVESGGWTYSETKDEMRGSVARFARIAAKEAISLPFPYGESTPQLTLRRDPKYGFDIFISANGQFLCRSWDDDTISVKFDDGGIEEWACADAESGSSDIVFITGAEAFLAKLKRSKRIIVEADMYEAGRQQMSFDVADLKWEGKDKK